MGLGIGTTIITKISIPITIATIVIISCKVFLSLWTSALGS